MASVEDSVNYSSHDLLVFDGNTVVKVGSVTFTKNYTYNNNNQSCTISRSSTTGVKLTTTSTCESGTRTYVITKEPGISNIVLTNISGDTVSLINGSKSYTYSSSGVKVGSIGLTDTISFGAISGQLSATKTAGGSYNGQFITGTVSKTYTVNPSNTISTNISRSATFSSTDSRTLLGVGETVTITATLTNSGAPYSATSTQSTTLNRASYEAFRLVSTSGDWSTILSGVSSQAKSYTGSSTSATFTMTKELRGKSFYPGASGENILYSGSSTGRYTGQVYGSKYTVNSLPRITSVSCSGIDQTNTATIIVNYTDADGFSSSVLGKYISAISIAVKSNSSINIPVSNLVNSSSGVCTATADFTQLVTYTGSISAAAEIDLLLSIKDGLEWSYADGGTTQADKYQFKPGMSIGYIRANSGSSFQIYPIFVNSTGSGFIQAKEIFINNGSGFISQNLN